ncbi:hypothetical protein GCM10011492_24290 [Flexivirga endophytica]|uniref:Uncharacterized protein n=1 Tax=Flexivirga endophytica TaxID=1849103 RepID=A0A916T5V3_9MICO|nr:hypothetical protein GCM10011492_24290 [Flexivirga endophytica]GHB40829.1 hypothetical protein GCM10008112_06680 [Flexivirga endophytica]
MMVRVPPFLAPAMSGAGPLTDASMAEDFTLARGVDADVSDLSLLLLGPLLLHAANGMAIITTAAAILLDLRIVYSDSVKRRDDLAHAAMRTADRCAIYRP